MTIDATVSGANSDSYCDVAYADAYHLTRGFNDEWAAADTNAKEIVLKWATRLLDRLNWMSPRTLQLQALRWPQMDAYDQDGWPVLQTVIHKNVKDAACEMALYLLREDRTIDSGAIGIDSLKVGPIAIDFSQTAGTKSIPNGVTDLIAHFLAGGGSSVVHSLGRA